MSVPLLETRQLSIEIAGKTVVDRMDLQLAAGECLAILGRNGAGKSTLLSTLAGLRPPAAGMVLLAGEDCADLPPRTTALRRGWLGQFQSDPFGSTVLETALTGRHPHLGRWDWESPQDRELVADALNVVGLGGMEGREVHTLSGGERQRLAIATLLTQAPPLYLLDEPLSHLDLNHQMAVLDLFARTSHRQDTGVIMVLHDPALAHRFCDRAVLVYGDGRTEQGPVDTILTAEMLSELYGHGLRQIDDRGHRCFIPE